MTTGRKLGTGVQALHGNFGPLTEWSMTSQLALDPLLLSDVCTRSPLHQHIRLISREVLRTVSASFEGVWILQKHLMSQCGGQRGCCCGCYLDHLAMMQILFSAPAKIHGDSVTLCSEARWETIYILICTLKHTYCTWKHAIPESHF